MTTIPQTRLDLDHAAPTLIAAMLKLEQRVELDETIKHLVKIRSSFSNGCAYCIDMHWAHARKHGESDARLAQVGAWQESPFFSDRERAALALTDAITHVGETHVPDDVWDEAAAHFAERELAHLVVEIAAINFWNRVVISTRKLPEHRAPDEAAA
jgi:AhpD family alkylhydroperoxidase